MESNIVVPAFQSDVVRFTVEVFMTPTTSTSLEMGLSDLCDWPSNRFLREHPWTATQWNSKNPRVFSRSTAALELGNLSEQEEHDKQLLSEINWAFA